jgi:hypothetical protein
MKESKDYKIVSSIMLKCMLATVKFTHFSECLSDISALSAYYEQFKDGIKVSPEAMNDPEHLEVIRKRHARNINRFKAAQDFHDGIVNGDYAMDVDIMEHPDFFIFLGKKYTPDMDYLREGKSMTANTFDELLCKDSFEHLAIWLFEMADYLDDVISRACGIKPTPLSEQDENGSDEINCDGDCEHCNSHRQVSGVEEFIDFFIKNQKETQTKNQEVNRNGFRGTILII